MKIYENLNESIKSMNMYGIYLFRQKRRWVIFYILRIYTPRISVLQREINCLNRENENRGFLENMSFDVQNAYQSHSFDENLK